jgi:hypothetical protein
MGSTATALVEAGDDALGFALVGFFLVGFTLVPFVFATTDADLDFDAGILPIGAEDGECEALDLGFAEELQDLALVEEEAAGAAGLVLGEAVGFVIGLDVEVVEPDLATLDPCEGIADVQAALADGFDFGSPEFHACFVTLEDLIIPERFSVGGDFCRHTAAGLTGRPWETGLFSDVLDLDLAVDDLQQGNVSITETWAALNER